MRSPVGNHELRQLEGRADDLWSRGDAWVKLGMVMERTATALTDISDSDVCKSQGTEKLAELAGDSADDLSKAAIRYKDTGRAVRTYANALDTAQSWIRTHQSEIESAERSYDSAVDAKRSADRSLASVLAVAAWETEPTAAESSAARDSATDAGAALASAETSRNELWSQFDHVFEVWSEAYDDAVDDIQKAMDSADNNDGFWEFVDSALEVLGWVLVALTVIALVIGAPLAGLLGAVILALSVLVLALTALKFFTGRATLSDLGLAALSLLPFGVGKLLSKGAPVLSTVIRTGRSVTTGVIRAGIPRMQLLRPSTWARPLRWAAAPWQSRAALARPGMFTNPGRTIALHDARLAQVETFLGTMSRSPWGQAPAVQQFVSQTAAAIPSRGKQLVFTAMWLGSFGLDGSQALGGVAGFDVSVPGLDDVRIDR